MHTVVETPAYLASAKEEGMTADEMRAAVGMIAADPMCGDPIPGTGGCRKVRIAGKGRGKSGGYRVVTFYSGIDLPVFLIAVLSKGSRANFSKAERNAMSVLTKAIVDAARPRNRKAKS